MLYSQEEPIHNVDDLCRVKKWVQKVKILYGAATVLAAIAIVFIFPFVAFSEAASFVETLGMYLFSSVYFILICWGVASIALCFKAVFKSAVKAGKSGYTVGEQFRTTHIQTTHEYGNHYKVSAHTENKGCLFALIAGVLNFALWFTFCVYVAPFFTFGKFKRSVRNIKLYEANQQ